MSQYATGEILVPTLLIISMLARRLRIDELKSLLRKTEEVLSGDKAALCRRVVRCVKKGQLDPELVVKKFDKEFLEDLSEDFGLPLHKTRKEQKVEVKKAIRRELGIGRQGKGMRKREIRRVQKKKRREDRLVDGKYELIKKLGEGGFGAAFLARNIAEPRLPNVVVKLARSGYDDALFREIEKTWHLSHEHICSPRYLGEDEEYGRYLVVPFAGTSIEELLSRGKPLPSEEAFSIVRQSARGLDYAHSKEIIHQDINPGNVLVDENGIARICDFGISARIVQTTGMKRGTSVYGYHQSYSAPELRQYRPVAHPSSDQYSLALVLCSMLKGKYFEELYFFQGLDELTYQQNESIQRALAKEPSDRHRNCSEFSSFFRE